LRSLSFQGFTSVTPTMKTLEGQHAGAAADLQLKIGDFEYPDLYKPQRLKGLLDSFETGLASADPDLFASWDEYRRNPAAPRSPVEISALLVGVASHVSRFIVRLFDIESDAETLAVATADQDPIFRFKVDFVRRRVLPNLKKL